MKHLLLILSLTVSTATFSQTHEEARIISIHPSVGNTIDVKEKQKFSLFPEYNDSLFESAQLLKYNDSTYTFLIKPVGGKSFERPADFNERQLYYNKIETREPASKVVTAAEPTDYYTGTKERTRNNYEAAGYIFETVFNVLFIILEIAAH